MVGGKVGGRLGGCVCVGGSSPRGGFGPRGSESGDTEAFFHTERIKLLRFRPLALFPVTLKAPLHRPCVYSWGEGEGVVGGGGGGSATM